MSKANNQTDSPVCPRDEGHDEAFESGYQTYWRGASVDTNPFQPGTAQYVAWNQGWVQGEIDQYEE